MQFLFEAVTMANNNPGYYLIYKTEEGYFAELVYQPGAVFHFHRINGEWTGEDPGRQYEAEQLGEVIDRKL